MSCVQQLVLPPTMPCSGTAARTRSGHPGLQRPAHPRSMRWGGGRPSPAQASASPGRPRPRPSPRRQPLQVRRAQAACVRTSSAPAEGGAARGIRRPCSKITAPFDTSVCIVPGYVQYDISAVRAIQKLYDTCTGTRAGRVPRTVSFADRVGHAVGQPRGFLHVRSRPARQCPDRPVTPRSNPGMHAVSENSEFRIPKCPD
jgi:hypothetical protein